MRFVNKEELDKAKLEHQNEIDALKKAHQQNLEKVSSKQKSCEFFPPEHLIWGEKFWLKKSLRTSWEATTKNR